MKRLDSLQGLRAVAFIGVFLGHCGIGGTAGMSVCVFFVLSGFLMVYNYLPKDDAPYGVVENIKFSAKRIERLYPLHLLMCMFMFMWISYFELRDGGNLMLILRDKMPALLSNIFLFQSWIPIRSFYFGYNGVAWFLSTCTFLYFTFPFLLHCMKRKWTRKKAFLSMVGVFLLQLITALCADCFVEMGININVSWFTYIFPLYRCGDFIIGCNLGYIFLHNYKPYYNKKAATVFEMIALMVMVASYLSPKLLGMPESIGSTVRFIPCASLLIYVLAMDAGRISKVLSYKIFVEIGNISGYAFLIHQVIINILQSVGVGFQIVPIVAFVITVGMSYAYIYAHKYWTKVMRR